MRKLPLLLWPCLLLSAVNGQAQTTTAAAGGEALGAGTVSWTVGQPFYETTTGQTGTSAQGVQQPRVSVGSSVNDLAANAIQLTIAPNPTRASVRLLLQETPVGAWSYALLTSDGRHVHAARIVAAETLVDMEGYAPGIYLLQVVDQQRRLHTTRIIKTH